MQRIAFVMSIRPGMEAEYERRHHTVWPRMLNELRLSGAHTYSIFRHGTQLFAYLEVADLAHYQAYLANSTTAALGDVHERHPRARGRFHHQLSTQLTRSIPPDGAKGRAVIAT